FKFEANQYSGTSYANNHVSHFYWSKDASVAYAEGYNDGSASGSDVFFTNETETTSKDGFTVNVGGTEQTGWRTLSTAEWTYLFNNHTKKWATVNGVNGYVIAPDGFEGTLADSYADDAALAAAGNLVFLPAAGGRGGSRVDYVGFYGYYWSSTAYDEYYAYRVFFYSDNVYPDAIGSRDVGCSVRLITE
ncbi:MAG: hypothetical protein MJY57_02230, partial [Bacteroidales bacterium]|nr:hypothetical protein [Bacteroidales bacterium]